LLGEFDAFGVCRKYDCPGGSWLGGGKHSIRSQVAFDRLFEIAAWRVESDQEGQKKKTMTSKVGQPTIGIGSGELSLSGELRFEGQVFNWKPGAHLALFAPVGKSRASLVDLISSRFL